MREVYTSATSVHTKYQTTILGLSAGVTYTFSIQTFSKDSQNKDVYSLTAKEATETTRTYINIFKFKYRF